MIKSVMIMLSVASADILSDYVEAPDANYGWFEESD
jgi:hypothetical protein